MGKIKKVKEAKKTKKAISLKKQFLILTAVPTLIICFLLTGISIFSMNSGLNNVLENGLKGVAATAKANFQSLDSGDFHVDGSGKVLKGHYVMSDNNELFLEIKKQSGMDSSFYYARTSVATSLEGDEEGTYRTGEEMSEEMYTQLKTTKEGVSVKGEIINGIKYNSYYAPVTNSDGSVVGALWIGQNAAEMDSFMASLVIMQVIVGIALLAVAVVFTVKMSNGIIKAVEINKKLLMQLADGDFNVVRDKEFDKILARNDEIGDMLRAMASLHNRLSEIISQMKKVSDHLLENGEALGEIAIDADRTTDDIGVAVSEVANGANHQAQEVTMATQNIIDMGMQIQQIVESVRSLTKMAQEMNAAGEASQQNIQKLSHTNDETLTAIKKVGEQILKTNESIRSINEAVDMISSIADQTTLLSLNASIEAARAGDAGRGFAVVAGEIQKLATESNDSATRIKKNIAEVVENSQNSMRDMEGMKVYLDQQVECLKDTVEQFAQLAEGIASAGSEAIAISGYAEQCDEARKSVEESMSTLAAISQQNASGAEETTASMDSLAATMTTVAESSQNIGKVAGEMSDSLKFFRLGEDSELQ